jgi:hypothetical protein
MKTITSTFALLLAIGLAGPAFAATSTTPVPTPTTNNSQSTSHESGISARQQVQSDLAKAGFTDIKIMPESFLIRAKDSKGNAVMMVINPDSFTEVTAMSAKNTTSASNDSTSTSNKMTKGSTASPAAPAPAPAPTP